MNTTLPTSARQNRERPTNRTIPVVGDGGRFVRCGSCRQPFRTQYATLNRRALPECTNCFEDRLESPHVIDPPAPAPYEPRLRVPAFVGRRGGAR